MKEVKFPFDIEKIFEKSVKNNQIPRNDFKKQAILLKLIDIFEDNKTYLEYEVNNKINKYFDDVALIRRELINFGYLQRNPHTSNYWVKKRKLTKDDIKNNTLLRRHARVYEILDD